MRERLPMFILVGLLIFLIAFVFAILGRGHYEPPTSADAAVVSGSQVALVASAVLPG